MQTLAQLHAASLPDVRLVAFRGRESLTRPYHFDLYFMGRHAIGLAGAVGSRATLRLARVPQDPFLFNGILASAELLVQTPEWALHHAVLVPKLWQLGLTRHSRVFTDMTIPEVIAQVLKASGLSPNDYELRLSGGYRKHELVVQYRESELSLLHRWMEYEGISYQFEQGEEREKLVIFDHPGRHDRPEHNRLRYYPLAVGDHAHREHVDAFAVNHRATVERVHVSDYDYARPMLEVAAAHEVDGHGFGSQYDHTGRFFDPERAQHYALIRSEELKVREVLYHLGSNALHIGSGYDLEIEDHPTGALNEKRYLVVEAHHLCNQIADDERSTLARWIKPEHEEVYRVEATLTDFALTYRPERLTPWPRIWGYENGVVDGPADSPYAQIDEQGRYLVKFLFDESDLHNGRASTWVRMMQPHGGVVEGFHFPLRKGTEVVFTFLGGDPDRPVIAGVVPNAARPSTITEANHTQNMIRTGSENFMKLEDLKGQEFIHTLSPMNASQLYMGNPWPAPGLGVPASYVSHTAGSGAHVIGANQHYQIAGFQNENVGADVTETYGANHNNKVAADHNHNIGSNSNVVIGSDHNHQVGANHNQKIGANHTHAVASNHTSTVGASHTHTIAADHSHTVGGDHTQVIGGTHDYTCPTTIEKITNRTENITNHTTNISILENTAGEESHVKGTSMEIIGAALNITGAEDNIHGDLNVLTGIEADAIGFREAAVGAEIVATGFHDGVTGVSNNYTGVQNDSHGIDLHETGPKIFVVAIQIIT